MIYFHIGLNKTGSSAIQDFFYSNREGIAERGVLYPEVGLAPAAHHGLAAYLDSNVGDPSVDEAYATAMSQADDVLFSSEALQEVRNLTRLQALVGDRPVRVIVYLRDPVTYLRSWWQQDVKASGLVCGFETYARHYWKSYSNVLRRWSRAFGQQAMIIRPYDRSRFPKGDILSDFLALVGSEALIDLFPQKDYDLNPSIGGNLLYAKLLYNSLGLPDAASEAMNDGLTELAKLKPEFSRPPLVEERMAASILSSYHHDLATVAHEFGVNVPVSAHAAGVLTPDPKTLAADLKLIWAEADKLGLPLSRARDFLCNTATNG